MDGCVSVGPHALLLLWHRLNARMRAGSEHDQLQMTCTASAFLASHTAPLSAPLQAQRASQVKSSAILTNEASFIGWQAP